MSQTAKDFSGQDLRGRNFKGLDLIGANFSHANLRGTSFKGQDLTRANFSSADIRGVNFSDAILTESNFTNAKAGLQDYWIFLATGIILLLSLSTCLGFVIATICLSMALLLTVAFSASRANYRKVLTLTIASAFILINSAALVFTVLLSLIIRKPPTILAIATLMVPIFLGFIVAIFLVLLASKTKLLSVTLERAGVDLIPISKALFEELIVTTIAVVGGTSFRGATLRNANFTHSVLAGVNLDTPKVDQVIWFSVEGLERSFIRSNNLINPKVRQLVVTRKGQDQTFDSLNLDGINLRESNLEAASFIRTNFNNANFKKANLSKAILKQTQLDGADLTGATLTGAYIEDWGITAETKLDGIKCKYVYMRVPTKDDPDPIRKPDNRNEIFQDDDFADFIRPLINTLDLYHNQGVDPRAIAISFKELAENNPDAELRIVAMEAKGERKFLLRAKTAVTADKSELSVEYFSTYNKIKALAEVEVRAIIAEKDTRIQSLEAMVVTALQSPSFYSHIGRADSVSNTSGINQNVSGGNVYGGIQAAQGSNNTQSQEIHSIASSEQGLTQDQVIELFAQLESVLRQPELPEEVQEKAVKYLDAAKAEVQEKEPDKQLAAGNLKRMAETIESTSKTMEAGKKIWETTKPVLEALFPWLGVAKGFFGF